MYNLLLKTYKVKSCKTNVRKISKQKFCANSHNLGCNATFKKPCDKIRKTNA